MDIFRVVTFSPGGRPIVQKDLETGVFYAKARDSFQITPGDKHQLAVSRNRRYGGAIVVGEAHDNWSVSATWLITGATQDLCLGNVSTFTAQLEAMPHGRFLEWRPDGATYSNFFVLRGTAKWTPQYKWVEFAGAQAVTVEVVFPVAPLVRGLPMDIGDRFDVDSKSDYTFDAGSAADVSVDTANSVLTATANLAVEKRMIHTARGYKYGDVEVHLKATPGSTITSFKAGAVFNWIDANNFGEVYVDDNGTNSRLRIDVVIAGARTNRASVNLASRIVNGSPLWIRGRIEGNTVYADHATADPLFLNDQPTTTTSYILSAAEAAVLGAATVGFGGLSWIPQSAGATITSFYIHPFTYRNGPAVSGGLLAEDLLPAGSIPGDAPALCDLTYGASNGIYWAAFGWMPRSPVYNRCWNGDFEYVGTAGWSVAAVAAINGAATSIGVQSSGSVKFGFQSAEVVCPATANVGTSFRMFKRFRKGIAYTAEVWVYSAAQTTSISVRLGNSAANDTSTSGGVALSAAYQKITVTWTPVADRDDAHIAVVINAATATTFRIDGVEVYEGTVAPTLSTQLEGRGGVPPFGIVEAEACDTSTLSGFAVTADAASGGGNNLTWSAIGNPGPTVGGAGWWIDPALLTPEDFTNGEVQVEVWARMQMAATLTRADAVLSLRAEGADTAGGFHVAAGTGRAGELYTAEFGVGGKSLLTAPGNKRFYRLGTLRMVVDRDRPRRWRMKLSITAVGVASTIVLDRLVLLPSASRALGPTGKPADSTYPQFTPLTYSAWALKTIRSDLSGLLSDGTANADQRQWPSAGLGGALLELPPGPFQFVTCPSPAVPDQPTATPADDQNNLGFRSTHLALVPRWQLARDA